MLVDLAVIEQLAPARLENCRASRYRGEDQSILLDALGRQDRDAVIALYAFLDALRTAADADEDEGAFLQRIDLRELPSLVERVQKIGERGVDDPRIAAALHDIRGGPLAVLSVVLTRYLRNGTLRPHTTNAVALAVRDHLKIMRNVVEDLDPPRRTRDGLYRKHSIADLSRALGAFPAYVGGEPAALQVECTVNAVMAESCVECGAIDRVAYNLVDNAVRHAQTASIRVWLLVIEENLRVAVANDISEAHAAALKEVDEASLFGAFTTSGSGKGLQIVADLVSRAYGIPSALVTEGHHVGAKLVERIFVTWFHWPLAGA